MKHLTTTLSIGALALGCLAFAADDLPRHPGDISYPPLAFTPPSPSEYRTTLPDGTPVFLAPSKEFPLINLVITFKGGSNLDPAGKSGLAAMTASQMRLGGTASMKASDLDERLDFLATEIGISSSDWTSSASLNCLASTFDESLAIMVDMLKSPGFDASKLEVAVAEALSEMKKRNDSASTISGSEWRRLSYGDEHYRGQQMTEAGLKGFDAASMKAMAASIFHPGNMKIAVTGDFDRKVMLEKLAKAFSGWTAGAEQANPPVPATSLVPGIYHVEKDIPQGKFIIGLPAITRDDPDYIPFMVMNDILGGGGFTSRITQRVRSDEGLAYSAGSQFSAEVFWPGQWRASFESKNATCALAAKLVLEEMARIRSAQVTAQELDTAKKSFIETFPETFSSRDATLGVFMTDEWTKRPGDYWTTFRDKVAKVTPADVQRVAQKYLDPSKVTILLVGKWDEIAKGDQGGRATMAMLEKDLGPVKHLPLRDPMTLAPLPMK